MTLYNICVFFSYCAFESVVTEAWPGSQSIFHANYQACLIVSLALQLRSAFGKKPARSIFLTKLDFFTLWYYTTQECVLGSRECNMCYILLCEIKCVVPRKILWSLPLKFLVSCVSGLLPCECERRKKNA